MSDENGMVVPDWTDSMKSTPEYEMLEAAQSSAGKVKVLEKEVVESFSTHFAEYEVKDKDLLVHLFPRRDENDRWYPSSLKDDGTYIPSRRETVTDLRFPEDMEERIKVAVDAVWQGDVAIDKTVILAIDPAEDIEFANPYEHDTGAYAVQFQDAANTASAFGLSKFMDSFCEALDKQLE